MVEPPTWGVAVPALPSGSTPDDVICRLPIVTARVMSNCYLQLHS